MDILRRDILEFTPIASEERTETATKITGNELSLDLIGTIN
jgi:hypothetical protein